MRRANRRVRAAVLTVAAVLATTMASTGAATAQAPSPPVAPAGNEVLAEGLVGPLHLDATPGSPTLVSQSFAGLVSAVGRDGSVRDLVSEPGNFIGGVAAGPFGSTFYLSAGESGALLKVRTFDGKVLTMADLGAYEARRNPDAGVAYGLQGLSAECLATLPDIPGLAPYTGIVDSNPYELVLTLFGVLVADAAGNDILLVDWAGNIRTIAVLPPRPAVISAEAAAALGLDPCVAGATLNFEPVPTDVEIGRNWELYVSSLPGGPEDPALVPLLGARGAVFVVNPFTGVAQLEAEGFAGATNVALSPSGDVYVAELFANRISKVVDGAPQTVAEVVEPAAIEWSRGALLATTNINGNGTLQRIVPSA